jgi:hypothetical protein
VQFGPLVGFVRDVIVDAWTGDYIITMNPGQLARIDAAGVVQLHSAAAIGVVGRFVGKRKSTI